MSTPSLATAPVGDVIMSRYRVDAVLEAGEAWIVIAATDLERDRRVTLKLLHPPVNAEKARGWLLAAAAIAALVLAAALLALSF